MDPLVSCIMPTRNRRPFIDQAIWYFLRQDYPSKELIIVDDGDHPVGDRVPEDARIRYIRLDRRHTLAAKRNIACQLSQGEWILHWDDDDWMAPDRLSLQVAQAQAARALMSGARQVTHYRLEQGDAWLGSQPQSGAARLFGGTLIYQRSAWENHPFPDVKGDEGYAFTRQFPVESIQILADASFYIALLHAGNAAPPNLASPMWQRLPLEEVSGRLGSDRDFYVQLRNQPVRHPPGRLDLANTINLAAPFIVYDGYGSVAEYLALGMQRSGAKVNVVPTRMDPEGISDEFKQMLKRSRLEPGAPTLCFCWPLENLTPFRHSRELFMYTMWESSRLPAGWSALLNRMQAVMVPSQFAGRVFRDSGVTVPIEVVTQGVDPAVYHYEERPERPGITTLMVGVLVPRKNIFEGVAAWKKAFQGDPDARLIVKARFQIQKWKPDDPRITLIDTNETSRGIAHYYREADVLMALGNEGFGLPLVEGMATGLPVIALNSEGQADVCTEAPDLVLPVEPARWQPFEEELFGKCGVRAIPNIEQVSAWLRWVKEHHTEAKALGKAASQWAIAHRNIWDMGAQMLDALELHVKHPRPLRRRITLWAPANGPLGSYARRMERLSSLVKLATQAPDLRTTQALHIFYEEGAFDEGELNRIVQQAGYCGVPVAVTEAKVGNEARPWEQQASILAALSPDEADRLRRRWPRKRVEHLPVPDPVKVNKKAPVESPADAYSWADEQHQKLWLSLTQKPFSVQA
jgi:glycosyltransferase involved in cell wall biosynthesis